MISNKLPSFKRKPIAALIALSIGLSSPHLLAQESDSEETDETGFEVIMVTASKRTTGLQETPIAVSVTGAEDIEQTKVLDIQDLQTLVPTLRVTPLQRSTNTNFAIRGFGNGTNNTGIEPSVGVFIDGVYRSRAAAQIGDLPRLDQIEVLSGPQSTLFGKNASAGVISVRTQAPSYDFESRIEAGFGNYNQRLLKGYVTNGISENVAFSLSGNINQRDGYTESIDGIGELNNRDRMGLRGQLLIEPSANSRIRIIADYSDIDENCCTVADVINGPTTAAIRALGGNVLDESDPFSYQSSVNFVPNDKVEDSGVSVQVDVDYDTFALTSITALRKNESSYIQDVDFTSLDVLTETAATNIDTFTQEFRLTSTTDGDFSWMVGAFVFQEEVDTGDRLTYGSGTRPYFNVLGLTDLLGGIEPLYGLAPGTFFGQGQYIDSQFTQDNDAYSIFVSLDYNLTEDLTATVGASYTNDEKVVTIESDNTEVLSSIDLVNQPTGLGVPLSLIPTLAPFIPTLQEVQFLPPQLEFPNSVEDGKTEDSKSTWSVRLAYQVNDNINLFATAATGFKASSWNLSRDTRPFVTDQGALEGANLTLANQSYGTRFAKPEESIVYEIGMKTRFENGAFNIVVFDQTIEEFQSSIFVGTGFRLLNAGEQSTTGIEFDGVYRPTDNIDLTFGGTILDPIFDSFESASGIGNVPINLTGTTPDGIHERSFTAGITYNFDLSNGAFGYVRTDYLYESEAGIVVNVPPELTREVSMWNASAGLTFENGVSLQVWVRNLNNDEFFQSAFPPPIQSGSFSAYPNAPRTFGASVAYEF